MVCSNWYTITQHHETTRACAVGKCALVIRQYACVSTRDSLRCQWEHTKTTSTKMTNTFLLDCNILLLLFTLFALAVIARAMTLSCGIFLCLCGKMKCLC